ncbi:phage portal protein [Secundilactobacillus kimchicus]|uniref:phage portal protein n=1 Tax=Secundilactobacillus kimchicus TaxID=528209 RepID=UPI0024A859DC|nr:phage portal protein [Secundilactobacillus kimchicus]
MAINNSLTNHNRSITAIHRLNGRRYGDRYLFEANQTFRIPTEAWDVLKDKPKDKDFLQLTQWYVNRHFNFQLPRILELQRYYQGDNNVHYWITNKKRNRSDNRIASGLPRYITNIQVGYQFGNPLTFGYTNEDDSNDDGEDVRTAIKEFNQANDEEYHEKIMAKNLSNTGRGYELLFVPEGEKKAHMTAIDPAEAFVVWTTDVEPKELFGVRYYEVTVADQSHYEIEVYTDTKVYYFKAGDDPASAWTLTDQTQHYFGSVPLIEYSLNEERTGKWEPKLDEIDGYDQAISEMANSQEDHSNATLLISGMLANNTGVKEQLLDRNGGPVYTDADTGQNTNNPESKSGKKNAPVMVQKQLDLKAEAMYLKPYVYSQPNGTKAISPTTATYLTKSLDANEWKIFVDQLLYDVHKDTNTPDMSDTNFSGTTTGAAMAYKLWGSDQEIGLSNALYRKSLQNRLRLLCNFWSTSPTVPVQVTEDSNPADNVTITFTPNLPKNNAETMQIVSGLVSTGVESDETVREMLEPVTGIPSDQEKQRVDDEGQKDAQGIDNEVEKRMGSRALTDDDDPDEDGDDDGGTNTTGEGKETDSAAGQAGSTTPPQAR